jgi:peptidoglycan/LPS O-acetylase OafA/YrhL
LVLSQNETILTKLYHVSAIPHFYMFLFGVLLQRHRERLFHLWENRFMTWLLIYLVAGQILAKCGLTITGNDINPLSALMLAFLTVSAAFSGRQRLSNVLRGNDISYGVYIYHMVVNNVFVHLGHIGHYRFLSLSIALTILLALISWNFVELPCIRRKKYTIKTEKREPAA